MKLHYFLIMILAPILAVQAQSLNPSFENWTIQQNQITVNGTATFQGFTADYEIDDPQFNYNEIVNWSSLNQLTGTESIVYPATNDPLVELVTESLDAVDGSKSVKLESKVVKIKATITIFGVSIDTSVTNTAPGLLVSGEFDLDEAEFADQLLNSTNLNSLNPFTYEGTGQPIDFQPRTLQGSYKYNGLSGDSAMLVSGLIKDRVVVAYVIKRLPTTNIWTDFELDYEYLSCDMPDTIISVFCSSNLDADFNNGVFSINSSYTGVNGSVLWLDNLRMDTLDTSIFPPIAVDDNTSIFDNEIATTDVTLNDDFCGGVAPTPTVVSVSGSGSVVVLASGALEYTPMAGFTGMDTVQYSVCNTGGLCDTAYWFVTVNAIPLCVPVDDFRSLASNTSSVFDATANDIDCGNVPNILVLPVNGVANVESNGFISYSPLVNFVGVDSLTYTLCSDVNPNQCATAKVYYEVVTGIKDVATYSITIAPNPANELVQLSLGTNEESTITIYNFLGQAYFNATFTSSTQINVSDFPVGAYVMKIENAKGSATRKLMIRR